MKQYHTKILIQKPKKEVWSFLTNFEKYPDWNPLVGNLGGDLREGGKIKMHIVPLNKTFSATLVAYKAEEEMTWLGVQGAKFLVAGKHYYRLKSMDENTTELTHGEYFTGIFAYFIPKSLLNKMEGIFHQHNETLKKLVESN